MSPRGRRRSPGKRVLWSIQTRTTEQIQFDPPAAIGPAHSGTSSGRRADMATRKPRVKRAKSDAGASLTLTDALLAQILLHSMASAGQEKKALTLRAAGVSNADIATLLGTTGAVVAQVLYAARARGRGTRSRKQPHAKRAKSR